MSDPQKSDFETAKAISDLLTGKDKDSQHRVLRWVAESLDIALHAHAPKLPETQGSPGASQPYSEPHQLPRNAPDIKTFIENKQPKSDIQFATATAYYYRFEAASDQRKESISADNLQDAARLVGRQRFAHPVMTLNNAKNQGYLDLVSRGAYRVNNVGENLIAMTLPSTGEGQIKGKRAVKKRAANKKAAVKKRPSTKRKH